MAYAGFRYVCAHTFLSFTRLTCNRFAESVIKAVKGEKGLVSPSFVYLPGVPGGEAIQKATGVDFFSVPIELGVNTDQSLKFGNVTNCSI